MATYVYVAAQDDNKVSIFTMDEASGALTLAGEQPVSGGPSLLAISPDRRTLYAGHREDPEISSYRIDQDTGGLLTQTGSVIPPGQPAFLLLLTAPDGSCCRHTTPTARPRCTPWVRTAALAASPRR